MPTVREVRALTERGPHSWAGALTDVTREHTFEPLRVEGRIPEALAGTLYRNGPGLFHSFDHHYEHWFDGDGLVSAVRFRDGRAEGGARVLETAGLLEERRRGKAYFGAYGTAAPGLFNPIRAIRTARGKAKNQANTSILAWAGRTFALCEIGKPFELDPDDLTSIGETDLGGAVPRTFSAHPHRLAANGFVYNIGVRVSRPAELDVMVLRADGTAGRVVTLPLDIPTMIHDFALTERALVVFVAPLRLDLVRTLLGRGSFAENLRWEPDRGTEVIVVPFDAPLSPIRFRVEPFWAWHIGNAFTRGDEIVMDLVRYRDFPDTNAWITAMSKGAPDRDADGILGRARLDAKRRTFRFEPMRERTGEFPRVAPSVDALPNRTLYWTEHSSAAVGRNGPPDTLVRVDTDIGATDEFRFTHDQWPSEGVFVPRPGGDREDDGWIVSLVYDARTHTSQWAVFEAAHLAGGPIARAHLDHHIPLTFHGAWVPAR